MRAFSFSPPSARLGGPGARGGPSSPPPALGVCGVVPPLGLPHPRLLRPAPLLRRPPRPAVPFGVPRPCCPPARARAHAGHAFPGVLPPFPLLPHAVTRAPACHPASRRSPSLAWGLGPRVRGKGNSGGERGLLGALGPRGARCAVGVASRRVARRWVWRFPGWLSRWSLGCDGGFVVGSEGVGVRKGEGVCPVPVTGRLRRGGVLGDASLAGDAGTVGG